MSNTGDNLEGVTVQIKNLETGETQSGKTASGGVIEFTQLKPGGYEVREIAGITGYVADVEATKTATVITGDTGTVRVNLAAGNYTRERKSLSKSFSRKRV